MPREGIGGLWRGRGGMCVEGPRDGLGGLRCGMWRGRVGRLFVGIELFGRRVVLTSLFSLAWKRDRRCVLVFDDFEIKNLEADHRVC